MQRCSSAAINLVSGSFSLPSSTSFFLTRGPTSFSSSSSHLQELNLSSPPRLILLIISSICHSPLLCILSLSYWIIDLGASEPVLSAVGIMTISWVARLFIFVPNEVRFSFRHSNSLYGYPALGYQIPFCFKCLIMGCTFPPCITA